MKIYISDSKMILTRICLALGKRYNQASFQHHGEFIVFYVEKNKICIKLDTVPHIVLDSFFIDGVKRYTNVMVEPIHLSKFVNSKESIEIVNCFESTKEGQRNFIIFSKANNIDRYQCKRLWLNSSHDPIDELLNNMLPSEVYDYLGMSLIAEEVMDQFCYEITEGYNKYKLNTKQAFIINEIMRDLSAISKDLEHYFRIKVYFNDFVQGFLTTLDNKEKFESVTETEELLEALDGSFMTVTACKHNEKLVDPSLLLNQFDIVDMFVDKYSKEDVVRILTDLFNQGLISNPNTNERSLPHYMTFKKYIETVNILLNSRFSVYKAYIKSKKISTYSFNKHRGEKDEKTFGIIPIGEKSQMDVELTKEETHIYEAICIRYLGIVAGTYFSNTYNIKANISDKGTINTSAEVIQTYGHEIFSLPKITGEKIQDIINLERVRKKLDPLKLIKIHPQIDDVMVIKCSTKSSRGITIKKLLKTLENCSTRSRISMEEKVKHKDLSIGSVESRILSINELIKNKMLIEMGEGVIIMDPVIRKRVEESVIPSTRSIISLYREIYRLLKKEVSFSDCLTFSCELLKKNMYHQFITKRKEDVNYAVIVEDNRCPICNGQLYEQKNLIMCRACGLKIYKVIKGVVLGEQHIIDLITNKETKVIAGFQFKNNNNGKGKLVLNIDERRVAFKFNLQ